MGITGYLDHLISGVGIDSPVAVATDSPLRGALRASCAAGAACRTGGFSK